MFHRANAGKIKPQSQKEFKATEQDSSSSNKTMEQSAVERYAKSQKGMPEPGNTANQNGAAPNAVQKMDATQQEEKEANPMNTPNTQAKAQPQQGDNNQQAQQPAAPQGAQPRVDIPGQNFQRPGQAQGNRPAYPGAYPGSAAPAQNQTYTPPASNSQGRQLNIGPGITMSGEIEACDHLVVEGTVEAALKGASVLEIAETGAFYGTVEIDEANIAGRFEGDITVKGRLTIQSTGTIIGSVSYKELSMEAGATLDGSVSPIGSQNAVQSGGKKAAPKARKVSQDNASQLPFSDGKAVAAE